MFLLQTVTLRRVKRRIHYVADAFASERTKIVIDCIFEEPTLHYKHKDDNLHIRALLKWRTFANDYIK